MYQWSLSPMATKQKNLSSLLKKNGVFITLAEREVFGTVLREATQLKDS